MAAIDQAGGILPQEPQLPSDQQVVVAWMRSPDNHERGDTLLARTVASVFGVSPGDVVLSRLCPSCVSSSHGRPVVLGLGIRTPFASLARADGLVVVAVSIGGPVGVDVERGDAPDFCGFEQVALHERERAKTVLDRATVWTRKEALLKATGHGLSVDPRLLEMSAPADPPQLLHWAAPDPPAGVWMATLALDPQFVACVAVLGVEAPQLTVQAAAAEEAPP